MKVVFRYKTLVKIIILNLNFVNIPNWKYVASEPAPILNGYIIKILNVSEKTNNSKLALEILCNSDYEVLQIIIRLPELQYEDIVGKNQRYDFEHSDLEWVYDWNLE